MHHIGFQTLASRYAHLATPSGKPLHVTFSGALAYTTPTELNLPAFESGTVLTPYQYLIYCGYLDHEIGHQRFTDFEQKAKCRTALGKALLNILEDPREEALQIAAYPGSKRYLDALCHYCDEKTAAGLLEAQRRGEQQSPLWLIYKEAYIILRKIDTGKIPGDLNAELKPIAELMRRRLPLCTSTEDCRYLAEEIEKLLPKFKPEPKPCTLIAKPVGELSADLDEFLQLSERGNIISLLIVNINQGQPSQPGQSASQPGQSGSKKANSKHPTQSGKVALPAGTKNDRIFVPSDENLAGYIHTRSKISAELLALKKMLRIYLTSRSQKAWARGLEEGELDRDRLASLAVGASTRIFKARRQRLIVDTAIELMIDLSSSMAENIVRSAAICLAESLAEIPKLKLSICGFSAESDFTPVQQRPRYPGIGRLSPMNILVFKDYDEQYQAARAKLGAIKTDGLTPLGDAYGKALERILTRGEPRRIIWLITDGKPEFLQGDRWHSDYVLMQNVHSRAAALGIESVALGIREQSAKPYVDHFFYINEIAELPTAVMQILKNMHP